MSEVDNSLVKLGYWTDWSRGSTMGQTITTSSSVSNIVIALLAILITIAMSQLWSLFTFLYHQLRARSGDDPCDGLFWQQQALLRTLPPPTSLFFDSLKIWWAWRRSSKRALLRSSIPIAMALVFAVAAVTSSIFSTYVVSSSNLRVLVNSPNCGRLNTKRIMSYSANKTLAFDHIPAVKTYAKDCYQQHGSLPSRCRNTFVKPNISLSISPADCPWDDIMCLPHNHDSKPAIIMDSGMVHGSQLGFNHEPYNDISFSKKTICNVLPFKDRLSLKNLTGFSGVGVARPLMPQEQFWVLQTHLRKTNNSGQLLQVSAIASDLTVNTSDAYNTNGVMLLEYDRLNPVIGVNLPLKEMNRTGSDVSIAIVWLNSVTHTKPNSDPLFSAHVRYDFEGISLNSLLYRPDHVVGVVGCAIQYQFCHSRKGRDDYCTPVRGLVGSQETDIWPEANDIQHLSLSLVKNAFSVVNNVWGPTAGLTLVGEEMSKGMVTALPDNQWEKEVFAWETYVWAGLQILLSDYAVGPKSRDPAAGNYTDSPSTEAEKQMCGAIVMKKSGSFANINVFGLAFIITFTIVVSILNTSMLRFFIFLSKSRRTLAPRLDHWVHDGVFQLQRRAFEARGQGTWKNIDAEIPITEADELLSSGIGGTNIGSAYVAQRRASSTKQLADSDAVPDGHELVPETMTSSQAVVVSVPTSVVSENTSTKTNNTPRAVSPSASVESVLVSPV